MRVVATIRWFSNLKGYGFTNAIKEAGGEEVFVHQKRFVRDNPSDYIRLEEGERIEFALIDAGKGPLADKIKVARG